MLRCPVFVASLQYHMGLSGNWAAGLRVSGNTSTTQAEGVARGCEQHPPDAADANTAPCRRVQGAGLEGLGLPVQPGC